MENDKEYKAELEPDADKQRATESSRPKAEEVPTLGDLIKQQAIEGEAPASKTFTLKKILGGDILTTGIIRRQIWLCLLVTFFVILYISNRYSCQQDLIEIDRLNKELKHAKYKALASSSQLTERCRESHVLRQLKENNDSLLHISDQPPYIIEVPNE